LDQKNNFDREKLAIIRKGLNKWNALHGICTTVLQESARSAVQEMNMAGFIHNEPPLVGHDVEVSGAITSEDAGFYFILVSAVVFIVAALTGHLA